MLNLGRKMKRTDCKFYIYSKNANIWVRRAAIIIHYALIALGFDFNRGVVGGVSGAIIGGWANSYLSKNS